MELGLRLQQDAPVLFSDFETKVLPAVNEAFGSAYTAINPSDNTLRAESDVVTVSDAYPLVVEILKRDLF